MSIPETDRDFFQPALTERRHGRSRERVAGPIAKSQELRYDDSPAIAAIAIFFVGLFIIWAAFFFFLPGPQQQRGLAVNETGAHAGRLPQH